jgi:hypothetical protein
MSDCNLTVDIIETPLNVYLGNDSIYANVGSDVINIRLLEETIKTYQFDQIFKASIDGFVGFSDIAVLASYFVFNEIPSGLINGVNKIYNLEFTPIAGTVVVFLNGLLQAPNFDYIITDNQIQFVKAPKINMDVYVCYIKKN